ncbi:MAG: GNAT family N-acetyltransferase [Breznakibacter sp.]
MAELKIVGCDLQRNDHVVAFTNLMGIYMSHPMGLSAVLQPELAGKMVDGLRLRPNYLGFLVQYGQMYVGLANCFENFSTFKAKPLLNIHDFIVDKSYQRMGIGRFLLDGIVEYAKKHGHCRVNLEVRSDNPAAMSLYRQLGFIECKPPMLFWERNL